eukprot:6077441-Amphidinium_carterae.1
MKGRRSDLIISKSATSSPGGFCLTLLGKPRICFQLALVGRRVLCLLRLMLLFLLRMLLERRTTYWHGVTVDL